MRRHGACHQGGGGDGHEGTAFHFALFMALGTDPPRRRGEPQIFGPAAERVMDDDRGLLRRPAGAFAFPASPRARRHRPRRFGAARAGCGRKQALRLPLLPPVVRSYDLVPIGHCGASKWTAVDQSHLGAIKVALRLPWVASRARCSMCRVDYPWMFCSRLATRRWRRTVKVSAATRAANHTVISMAPNWDPRRNRMPKKMARITTIGPMSDFMFSPLYAAAGNLRLAGTKHLDLGPRVKNCVTAILEYA